MKFSKPFKGVPNGEIYPVDYAPGDECPPELEEAARGEGVLAKPEKKEPSEAKPADK